LHGRSGWWTVPRKTFPSGIRENIGKFDLTEGAYEATDFFPDLGKKGLWLRFTAAVIRDSQGDLVGAVETLQDITEQKAGGGTLLKPAPRRKIRFRHHDACVNQADLLTGSQIISAEIKEVRP